MSVTPAGSGERCSQKSLAERLSERFYTWELPGRGWELWDEPVELEPRFRTFSAGAMESTPHVSDDGRRPTWLSRIADRLSGDRRAVAAAPDDTPGESVLPRADGGPRELVELSLSLPQGADVAPEVVEQWFVTLPRLVRPLTFELLGRAERIVAQVSCERSDQSIVTGWLRAMFPEATITASEGELVRAWGGCEGGHEFIAEMGLADEFMLPLRTFRRLGIDPLTALGAALSDLEGDECGVYQVLLEPVRRDWAGNIRRAVTDGRGAPFFVDAPEITKLVEEKVSRPLFACIVRVAARSQSQLRALGIARSLGWALKGVAVSPGNHLIPLHNEDYSDEEHRQDLLGRRSHRSGMILGSAELVSLAHPPSASVRLEKLVRETRTTRAAPAIVAGPGLHLGSNSHAGTVTPVSLSADQRSRHLYVIGASGTGKSTLLQHLILQDLKRGEGLALLDPHGDLVDDILLRMPPERVKDVVLIDPADAEYPIGFNILSAHTELERTLLASDLVSVFRRLSTSWGDQMTSVLGNAVLAILEHERGGTLVDLRRFLVEPDFRREFLKGVEDQEVVYYWQKEFPLLAGKPQAPLLTRLDTFLRPKTIRHMVAQRDSRLDLRQAMDEGKVILARLSQGAIGEENAYLLGTLLVAKFQQLAISRQELDASERRPFYLYLDEFQNFVTPSMEAILSGARKYGLGLILAHQDLRQIQSRSADVLNSVLSNPYSRICFRVGDHDARTLADGLGHFDAKDLQSLGTGQAIMRVERAEFDFNLTTPMLPPADSQRGASLRAAVVERSRTVFGRPRAEIEALLRSATASPRVISDPVEPPTPPTPARHSSERVLPLAPPERAASPPDVAPATVPPAAGRGGAQHRYLQELIRRWADANDWRATLEEEVLGGLGRIDVALRKGERSIACEIGISTSAEHELQNIQKCLAAGFERVVHVSADKKAMARIRASVDTLPDTAQSARVSTCLAEELFALLDAFNASESTSETTVRGYRVKVRHAMTQEGDRVSTRGAVSAVIAKAMKRLRRGKN